MYWFQTDMERIMGSYGKLFLGGNGGLIPVRNSSKSKYCSLFSKYLVQIKYIKSNYEKKTCSTTTLSQKVNEGDFYSHVFANIYIYTLNEQSWKQSSLSCGLKPEWDRKADCSIYRKYTVLWFWELHSYFRNSNIFVLFFQNLKEIIMDVVH